MSDERSFWNAQESLSKPISRRAFIRLAGLAGATVTVGGGLTGLIVGCGDAKTITTTSSETTTAAVTSSTSASAATTVAAGGEKGRPFKVGVAAPKTGALASFAVPVEWYLSHTQEATKDGVVCGDGKVRTLDLQVRDTQSDSNRAATVTADLIQVDNVDIMTASGSPDVVSPSADQCEALGTPGIFNQVPWQSFAYGRKIPPEGFKWTYLHDIGSEQTITNYVYAFEQIPNNKKVGMLFANDADAAGWMDPSAAPRVFAEHGYELIVPTYYTEGAEDFTAQISMFKKEGCDIVSGCNTPPSFINFWKQAYQQGYQPKLVSTGKGLIFPEVIEAMGGIGENLIGELTWHPEYPYKDSITGWDGYQIVDDYERKTGRQWTSALKGYALMEWVVDILKRCEAPEDKEAVIQTVAVSKFTDIVGPMDFTSPIDVNTHHPVKNVYKAAYAAMQWVKGPSANPPQKWPYVANVVAAVEVPGFKGTLEAVRPMAYES